MRSSDSVDFVIRSLSGHDGVGSPVFAPGCRGRGPGLALVLVVLGEFLLVDVFGSVVEGQWSRVKTTCVSEGLERASLLAAKFLPVPCLDLAVV